MPEVFEKIYNELADIRMIVKQNEEISTNRNDKVEMSNSILQENIAEFRTTIKMLSTLVEEREKRIQEINSELIETNANIFKSKEELHGNLLEA
jgi:hypothetical protein